MANYGPPGADRPEPWHGRQPEEPYGRPGDPRDRSGWDERRDRSGWDEPTGVFPGGQGYPPAGPVGQGRHPGGADPGYAYQPDDRYPSYDPYPQYDPHAGGGGYPYGGGEPQAGGGYPYGEASRSAGAYRGDPYPPAGPYASEPTAGPPAYLSNGPGAFPVDPVPPPERPSRRGRTIAVLAVLAVLVLGGAAALFQLAGSDDPAPDTALPSVTAAPLSDPPDAPTSEPADVSPTALAPESSADPRFAKVGQCVRNEGPAGGRPKLLVAGCAPKTYEVLQRFDGATSGEKDAEAKCAKVAGYTDWYFYNSELDTLDFVLCLKLR